jgi:hypothetical protein
MCFTVANQLSRTSSLTAAETESNLPDISKLQGNMFVHPLKIGKYITENENQQKRWKTISHQRLLKSYLIDENVQRLTIKSLLTTLISTYVRLLSV